VIGENEVKLHYYILISLPMGTSKVVSLNLIIKESVLLQGSVVDSPQRWRNA
jgi:hypothetical protein